jgi:hypothetical protein
VIEEFLRQNAEFFDAEIVEADFTDPATVGRINAWVAEKTEDMIPEILEEISDEALMFLINAIAFEADWANPFPDSLLRDGDFTAADGRVQTAEMMWTSLNSHILRYIETDDARGFVKPYAGNHYSFAAILPNEGINIADYIAAMTGESLMNTLNSARRAGGGVRAALPKFSFEYDITMNSLLADMGMPTAFDEWDADFSRLGRPLPPLLDNIFIERVLHKTFIEVDQIGTRAGAATLVEMASPASVPPPPEVVVLDRPFVFAIVDNSTNLPIFIGSLLEIPDVEGTIPEPICLRCDNCSGMSCLPECTNNYSRCDCVVTGCEGVPCDICGDHLGCDCVVTGCEGIPCNDCGYLYCEGDCLSPDEPTLTPKCYDCGADLDECRGTCSDESDEIDFDVVSHLYAPNGDPAFGMHLARTPAELAAIFDAMNTPLPDEVFFTDSNAIIVLQTGFERGREVEIKSLTLVDGVLMIDASVRQIFQDRPPWVNRLVLLISVESDALPEGVTMMSENCLHPDWCLCSGGIEEPEPAPLATVQDAIAILRRIVNLPSALDDASSESLAAFAIENGISPTVNDAIQILRYVIELPNKLDGSLPTPARGGQDDNDNPEPPADSVTEPPLTTPQGCWQCGSSGHISCSTPATTTAPTPTEPPASPTEPPASPTEPTPPEWTTPTEPTTAPELTTAPTPPTTTPADSTPCIGVRCEDCGRKQAGQVSCRRLGCDWCENPCYCGVPEPIECRPCDNCSGSICNPECESDVEHCYCAHICVFCMTPWCTTDDCPRTMLTPAIQRLFNEQYHNQRG